MWGGHPARHAHRVGAIATRTVLDDIAAVYPEMDAEALTERLARILFVADVEQTTAQ